MQVQSRLKEAELNKSAAYKDYQIALQNLNVLMGVPPMTPVEIADAITTVQPLPMHIGEEAALQNRPDFTISRLNVEYQKRQINLSKAKYNPTLAIGFQGNLGHSDVERERVRPALDTCRVRLPEDTFVSLGSPFQRGEFSESYLTQ